MLIVTRLIVIMLIVITLIVIKMIVIRLIVIRLIVIRLIVIGLIVIRLIVIGLIVIRLIVVAPQTLPRLSSWSHSTWKWKKQASPIPAKSKVSQANSSWFGTQLLD